MAKQTASPADAFRIVYDALEPLQPEERRRVVTSVLALFGTPGVEVFKAAPAASTQASVTLAAPVTTSAAAGRPLGLVEFLNQKQPVSNWQRIASFAFYRERYESQPRFSRGDLKPYFAKARLPPGRNFDRDFNRAVSLGWIHEDGADSYLTTKGVEVVEAGFGGKRVVAPKRSGKRATKKRK